MIFFKCFLEFVCKIELEQFFVRSNKSKMLMKRLVVDLYGSLSVVASISLKIIIHAHASVCLCASVFLCLRVTVSVSPSLCMLFF